MVKHLNKKVLARKGEKWTDKEDTEFWMKVLSSFPSMLAKLEFLGHTTLIESGSKLMKPEIFYITFILLKLQSYSA